MEFQVNSKEVRIEKRDEPEGDAGGTVDHAIGVGVTVGKEEIDYDVD